MAQPAGRPEVMQLLECPFGSPDIRGEVRRSEVHQNNNSHYGQVTLRHISFSQKDSSGSGRMTFRDGLWRQPMELTPHIWAGFRDGTGSRNGSGMQLQKLNRPAPRQMHWTVLLHLLESDAVHSPRTKLK
jgi:hypothetical protein